MSKDKPSREAMFAKLHWYKKFANLNVGIQEFYNRRISDYDKEYCRSSVKAIMDIKY